MPEQITPLSILYPFVHTIAVKVVKVKMVIFNFGCGHLAHYI